MEAQRLADGRIRIPARAEGPGGVIGDGMRDIGSDDPAYAVWDAYLVELARYRQPDGSE